MLRATCDENSYRKVEVLHDVGDIFYNIFLGTALNALIETVENYKTREIGRRRDSTPVRTKLEGIDN